MAGMGIQLRKFDGTDTTLWWHSLLAWKRFYKVSDEDTLAALTCTFEESARVWLTSLTEAELSNFDRFKTSFDRRFINTNVDINFMSIKQEPKETISDYVTRAEKQAINQAFPEEVKVIIITQGLLPDYKSKVISKDPKTFEDLRRALQIATAELECSKEENNEMVNMFAEIINRIGNLEKKKAVNSVQTSQPHPKDSFDPNGTGTSNQQDNQLPLTTADIVRSSSIAQDFKQRAGDNSGSNVDVELINQ